MTTDQVSVVVLDEDPSIGPVTVVQLDDATPDPDPVVVLVEDDSGVGPVEVVLVDEPAADPSEGSVHQLDDLIDVDAPPEALGVLTRDRIDSPARFEPLPDPPAPAPVPQRHVQDRPAARWQIVHGLGYRPHFDVHLPDGELLLPLNVEHPVPGSISELVFGAPFAGYADP